MTAKHKLPNIFQRLNSVMNEVTYIQKESKSGMRYSIVSHDKVTAKVRPAFLKHGIVTYMTNIVVKQEGTRTELSCNVVFTNIDDPTDYIEVATCGYGVDTQDKGPGKAMSYAFKYALLKTLCLETGDDPDYDQNVEYENPDDPHILAINKFRAAIPLAKTMEELESVLNEHKSAVAKAGHHYKKQVDEARNDYRIHQKKLNDARKED